MPSLQHALASLADTLSEPDPSAKLTLRIGVVTGISAGTGVGGTDVVTVTIGSDDLAAPRLASYSSPSVDDVVAVLLVNCSPLILGRVTGAPIV